MPFALRGKVFKLESQEINQNDKSSKEEVAELTTSTEDWLMSGEELYPLIQELPAAEDIKEEVEENKQFLNQAITRGAMEKEYIVVAAKSEDKIKIGATDDIHTCMGIAIYNRDTKQLVVAHVDTGSEANYLSRALDEFKGAKKLEVRFFGGLAKLNPLAPNEHILSIERAKKIYGFFYHYGINSETLIDIRSANTFEKLIPFKDKKQALNKSTAIGFAIDSENGKVQLYYDEDMETFLPYTRCSSCGIFQEHYKRGLIHLRMRRYLGFLSEEIVKQFDNRDSIWNAKHQADIEVKSVNGIVDTLVREFAVTDKACNLTDMDTALRGYITQYLKTEYSKDKLPSQNDFFAKSLLHHIAIQLYQTKFRAEPYPFTQEQDEKNLLMQLLKRDSEIRKWCYSNVCTQIADFVCELIKNDTLKKDLLSELEKIPGRKQLVVELNKFKRAYYEQLHGGGADVSLDKKLLLSKLMQAEDITDIKSLITGWKQTVILHRSDVLVELVATQINRSFQKTLADVDKESLLEHICSYFANSNHPQLLDLLYIDAPPLPKRTQAVIDDIAELLAGRIYYLHCCYSALNDEVCDEIDLILGEWIKNDNANVVQPNAKSEYIFVIK